MRTYRTKANLFYTSRVFAFSLVIISVVSSWAVKASDIYVQVQHFNEAGLIFTGNISDDQQSSDGHDAMFFYELGLKADRAGKYQDAVAAFQRAILLKPDFAEAYNNLGFSYYSIGENRKALEAIRHAILIDPEMGVAFSNLGNVNIALGHNKQAISLFKEALRLGLNDAVTHCSLGVAHYRAKHYREAAESFRTAITLNAEYAVAHFNLGATYWALKNRELALEQHAWLKEVSPSLAAAFLNGINRKRLLVLNPT